MNDRAQILLAGRREALARALGRPLGPPTARSEDPLSPDRLEHLLEDAKDLYWNELEWEHLTAEEETEGEPLVPLVFPGFLAFVRGLLLDQVMPDALAPAEPRPEVVERLLAFLANRVLELEEELGGGAEEEAERLRGEMTATDGLLHHVLYLVHGLGQEEIEKLEASGPV